jgi:hypothetical protein
MSDIAARLRAEIPWEQEIGELLEEAAAEIERLRLTDAERVAIGRIAGYHDIHVSMDDRDTLRGLLERLG